MRNKRKILKICRWVILGCTFYLDCVAIMFMLSTFVDFKASMIQRLGYFSLGVLVFAVAFVVLGFISSKKMRHKHFNSTQRLLWFAMLIFTGLVFVTHDFIFLINSGAYYLDDPYYMFLMFPGLIPLLNFGLLAVVA